MYRGKTKIHGTSKQQQQSFFLNNTTTYNIMKTKFFALVAFALTFAACSKNDDCSCFNGCDPNTGECLPGAFAKRNWKEVSEKFQDVSATEKSVMNTIKNKW